MVPKTDRNTINTDFRRKGIVARGLRCLQQAGGYSLHLKEDVMANDSIFLVPCDQPRENHSTNGSTIAVSPVKSHSCE